jgi:hypothetical protein
MADHPDPKTPLVDNLALQLARLYYRKDRSRAGAVWQQAQAYANPPTLYDDFLEGGTIQPARQDFVGGTGLWDIAFINGSSRVAPPPHGEAGDILVQDSLLKLQVKNDPNHSLKSSKWRKGVAAAEQYNNAYVVGLGGFLPKPRQAILVQSRMKISPGFHGSTGIWVQETNTFDPQTGIMIKPFRSFGFSYLGEASDAYIRGLAIETVLGLSIQDKLTVRDVEITDWHIYSMRWSWMDAQAQSVEFMVDDRKVGRFRMHPFGPAEIQLWADNYQIGRGLKIGYLNVPDVDESTYDWVKITSSDL